MQACEVRPNVFAVPVHFCPSSDWFRQALGHPVSDEKTGCKSEGQERHCTDLGSQRVLQHPAGMYIGLSITISPFHIMQLPAQWRRVINARLVCLSLQVRYSAQLVNFQDGKILGRRVI